MLRLRDIFRGKARRQGEILLADAVDVADPADDAALFLLMGELGGLGEARVPAAAKQRGWVQVRTEVRTRQARGAFTPAGARLRGAFHARRLALGSTVALVAIALGVAGVLNLGGPDRDADIVDVSITTTDTIAADNSSTTQNLSSTTTGVPATTKPITPGTTAPSSSPTSDTPRTTSGTAATGTTQPPPRTTVTEPQTGTTQPASTTTTTGEQMMTAQERERSAKAASALLAAAVISGDSDDTLAVLSSSARRGLAQMVSVLQDPQTYGILSVEDVDPLYARVLVQFMDHTRDAQGQSVDAPARFLFELRVDVNGAIIIGIYSAPGR